MSNVLKIIIALVSLVLSEIAWMMFAGLPWISSIFVCLSIIMFLGAILDHKEKD